LLKARFPGKKGIQSKGKIQSSDEEIQAEGGKNWQTVPEVTRIKYKTTTETGSSQEKRRSPPRPKIPSGYLGKTHPKGLSEVAKERRQPKKGCRNCSTASKGGAANMSWSASISIRKKHHVERAQRRAK